MTTLTGYRFVAHAHKADSSYIPCLVGVPRDIKDTRDDAYFETQGSDYIADNIKVLALSPWVSEDDRDLIIACRYDIGSFYATRSALAEAFASSGNAGMAAALVNLTEKAAR